MIWRSLSHSLWSKCHCHYRYSHLLCCKNPPEISSQTCCSSSNFPTFDRYLKPSCNFLKLVSIVANFVYFFFFFLTLQLFFWFLEVFGISGLITLLVSCFFLVGCFCFVGFFFFGFGQCVVVLCGFVCFWLERWNLMVLWWFDLGSLWSLTWFSDSLVFLER